MTDRYHKAEQPPAALLRLVHGYQISQALHAAGVLGLADQLRDGPLGERLRRIAAPHLHRPGRATGLIVQEGFALGGWPGARAAFVVTVRQPLRLK